MRWVHALGAAVAATTLVGSVAKATLSVSLVPVPVNATAATAIAGSQPVRTFQLKVTQSAGEKWNVGSMKVTLGTPAKAGSNLSGYFYASPNHDNTQARNSNIGFNQGAGGYAVTDVNRYDTYVSTPQFDVNSTGAVQGSNLNVAGSSDFPTGPGSATPVVPTTAGNSAAGNQTLDIVWGDQAGNQATTATDGSTSYIVAQFTVVGNTGGFIRGYSGGTAAANTPLFFPSNAAGTFALPQGTMLIPVLGDTNLDGTTDFTDFVNVKNNFNGTSGGDTDGDGDVDFADFVNVKNNFNNGLNAPSPGSALGSLVPEPASLALLGLAGLAGRRRRI